MEFIILVELSAIQKLFREAIVGLSITVFGGLLTGILWSQLTNILQTDPALFTIIGIFALIPVIGQMRGNISGIFISRLGTGLHLGTIHPSLKNRSNELNNTILMNILISLFSPIWVAIIVFIFDKLNRGNIAFYTFIFIAMIAGIISASLQIILALIVAFSIFRSGRDPDVLAYPILSATGDVITAIGMIGSIFLFQSYFEFENGVFTDIISLFSILFLVVFLVIIFSRPIRSRLDFNIFNLLAESIPIIFIATIIGAVVGILTTNLGSYPGIILLVPVFMAYTGSLGAIVGSKFTTAYYLGALNTKEGKISIYIETPLVLFAIGLFLSTILGIIAYNLSIFLAFDLPPNTDLIRFLSICWAAGLITTLFSIFNSLLVGNISFQRGIDADNIIVPITSTFGDLVAILTIITTITIFV